MVVEDRDDEAAAAAAGHELREEQEAAAAERTTRSICTAWMCTAADTRTPHRQQRLAEVFRALAVHLSQDHRMSDLCLTHANLWPLEADDEGDDDDDDDNNNLKRHVDDDI